MKVKVIGGKYQVLELLGKGAMCAVFRARHADLGRVVAVKVPLPVLREHPNGMTRFAHEARTMAALHHPAIVQVFEVGDEGGVPFMAMELVEGSDLEDALREGRLGPAEGLRLLASVADALEYAGSRGVIHRDLKPANVMVARDGSVKVADWGLALALEGSAAGTQTKLTATGRTVGTPLYMSPEQIYARPLTPASDCYALGLLAYVVACETFPGGRRPSRDEFMLHLSGALAPLTTVCPGVPQELASLVEGLLGEAPDARPGSGEAARTLRRVAGDLADEVPEEAPAPVAARRASSASLRRSAVLPRSLVSGASTESAGSSGPDLRRLVSAALCAVVACAVALHLWGGGAREDLPRALPAPALSFRPPAVRGLDQVVLSFEGEPRGEVRLTFGAGRGPRVVDLATARPLSRTLHELVVTLPDTLVRKASMVIHVDEGREVGRFELDPTDQVEAELRAVDALGEGLDGLLRRLGELRTRLVRQRGGAGYDEHRAAASERFRDLLGAAGLGRARQETLGRLLPALLEGEFPSGALARRLMPLRLIEMAVSERDGVRPPWGSVAAMLGFSFRGIARLQEVTPPPGHRRVGFCQLMSMVASPDGTGRLVPQYFWMVDPEGKRHFQEREALAGMFSAGLAATVDEVIPRHDTWVSTATSGLLVTGPVSPPARLYLVLAGLIPGFLVEVTLPGGESVEVLHVADLDPGFVPAPLFTRFLVSFPVEARGVVEGRNDVGLRLTKRSMGEPPLGLAFREMGLWAREGRGP